MHVISLMHYKKKLWKTPTSFDILNLFRLSPSTSQSEILPHLKNKEMKRRKDKNKERRILVLLDEQTL